MGCILTFSRSRRRQRRGMTIPEVLVGLAVGVLLIAAVVSFASYTAISLAALVNHVDLDSANRLALDTMTREIRQCRCLTKLEPNRLELLDYDGVPVVYEYLPDQRF